MRVVTDILNLRESHLSSVTALLAALDQVREAPPDKILARVFLAGEAADLVLTNVAAHVADALGDPMPIRKARRGSSPSRRKTRFGTGPMTRQRALFA
jgi:hypothetical protein